jgi:toxin-antitoxin system PIN domain toxin
VRALLDVNVLIALLDADHVHHRQATDWLSAEHYSGWASCPITQNGCLRIMSQPAYPGALPMLDVMQRLAEATQHPAHEFWADSVSLVQNPQVNWQRLSGPRQITDAYLLALAVGHGGRFVTLDSKVPLAAVPTARPGQLVVLAGVGA